MGATRSLRATSELLTSYFRAAYQLPPSCLPSKLPSNSRLPSPAGLDPRQAFFLSPEHHIATGEMCFFDRHRATFHRWRSGPNTQQASNPGLDPRQAPTENQDSSPKISRQITENFGHYALVPKQLRSTTTRPLAAPKHGGALPSSSRAPELLPKQRALSLQAL